MFTATGRAWWMPAMLTTVNGYRGWCDFAVTRGLVDGRTVYVRENFWWPNGTYYIPASARWGLKLGKTRAGGISTLELLAEPDLYDRARAAVEALDTLHRPVRKAPPRFTRAWAESLRWEPPPTATR